MSKSKIPSPDALIAGIQQAERELEKAREAMVQGGAPSDWQFVPGTFVLSLEDLFLRVRDAVRVADETGAGAFMNQLKSTLDGTNRLLMARRAIEGDRLNNPAAKFNRLLQTLDQLIPVIRRLDSPPRPPVIESPRQIQKSLNQPGDSPDRWLGHIRGVWKHVPMVQLSEILFNPDMPDLDPATHPDVEAWDAQQRAMPDFDDSILMGECRSIERARERGAAPAIV